MTATTRTGRPSTVPASPEVLVRQVANLDPSLLQDITTARRRLEQLAPEVVELLTEIRVLENRAFDVADVVDPAWDRVMEVTGARELMDAAAQLVRAYPLS